MPPPRQCGLVPTCSNLQTPHIRLSWGPRPADGGPRRRTKPRVGAQGWGGCALPSRAGVRGPRSVLTESRGRVCAPPQSGESCQILGLSQRPRGTGLSARGHLRGPGPHMGFFPQRTKLCMKNEMSKWVFLGDEKRHDECHGFQSWRQSLVAGCSRDPGKALILALGLPRKSAPSCQARLQTGDRLCTRPVRSRFRAPCEAGTELGPPQRRPPPRPGCPGAPGLLASPTAAPLPTDPGDPEELDQTVVCAEAGGAAHLQDAQGGPVGGHRPAALLRAHRAALQEGRLLLQALPPTGPVRLGREGTAGARGPGRGPQGRSGASGDDPWEAGPGGRRSSWARHHSGVGAAGWVSRVSRCSRPRTHGRPVIR